VEVAVVAGALQLTSTEATKDSAISVYDVKANNGSAVADINIVGKTDADIKEYINAIDVALEKVTAGASSLGAVKSRIDMQTEFVSNLMNTIEKGIGALVDADMTEESTKLKALQTQQQLGVQALSIANNSSQSLLSLFR
ncbi:MAG: flagellin, partial [Pseudomonadota bacterium]|nr:flagellin [Pseudomonadota bacterium]